MSDDLLVGVAGRAGGDSSLALACLPPQRPQWHDRTCKVGFEIGAPQRLRNLALAGPEATAAGAAPASDSSTWQWRVFPGRAQHARRAASEEAATYTCRAAPGPAARRERPLVNAATGQPRNLVTVRYGPIPSTAFLAGPIGPRSQTAGGADPSSPTSHVPMKKSSKSKNKAE
jgi:hypothetical protein